VAGPRLHDADIAAATRRKVSVLFI